MHEPWNIRDWAVWLVDRARRRPSHICTCCGKPVWGTPTDFSQEIPWGLIGVGGEDFEERVELTPDYCTVDGKMYFIRGMLELPIIGTRKRFGWGVWCDVSEESFRRYLDTYETPAREEDPPYFGWLCAILPGYREPTLELKTRMHPRPRGDRPWIEVEPGSHQIADEQTRGISIQRWHELVNAAQSIATSKH